MPTTLHGKITLEQAWADVTKPTVTERQIHKAVALALVSIALSLRTIAGVAGGIAARRP